MASFSELIAKMANKEDLNDIEKQQVVLQARALEQSEALLTSIVRPGTKILVIDGLITNNAQITDAIIHSATAGDGSVIIDSNGITLENDQQSFKFRNAAGVANIIVWTDSNDNLAFYQGNVGSFFVWQVEETDGGSPSQMTFEEGLTGQASLRLRGHAAGEMLNVGDALYLLAEGDTSGDTSIIMHENATASPNDFLGISQDMQFYLRNGKFVIKYSDAGTIRYKYLDLTGTGVTWTHTTSAP